MCPATHSKTIYRVWADRRPIAVVTLCLIVFNLATKAVGAVGTKPLKVGFVMVGPVNDMGWNWAHEQGRQFLEAKLAGRVQTSIAEKVPENAESERVMERMIIHGDKLIFLTSYGYLEPALRVAARHPDVIFMQVNRPNKDFRKNIGTYFVNSSDPMYAAGIVAGRMTKTNEIGYELGHPVPVILLNVNAFTLGARSVNPKVKVHVVWTNNWSDPPTEAEAAKGLIERGADVIVSHFDSSLAATRTAEKNGVFSVACNGDIHVEAPKGWLTGQAWNWGPLYVKIANSVIDGSWKAGDRRYDIKDGFVALSAFGNVVPKAVREEASVAIERIKAGQLVVFHGPLRDRDGFERISKDTRLNDDGLMTMDWFVAGVEGTVPQK